jgi:lipid-A-disaccharide synthase
MKYFVIAGEASGDLHGGNLLKELYQVDKSANVQFWGGDYMASFAGKPLKHINELAFMGFVEVLMNLRTILGNMKLCKKQILDFKPDAIIMIDYPGFNLRIAEWAKEQDIKIYYYISPQVWAWKQKRVHKIKKLVDHMMVILPFEKDFYKKFDYDVEFVGHPLIDAIDNFKKEEAKPITFDKKVIALLPGSRQQEVKVKLPIMLSVASTFPEYQFVIAGAPTLDKTFYETFTKEFPNVSIVFNQTYQLLSQSHTALVTSGTATLETALFHVPEVVCYKGSAISYHIAKRLIKIDYISLVNLIMDKEVVKELIQSELNKENIETELRKILSGEGRQEMLSEFKTLEQNLGGIGASRKVAESIYSLMKKS